MDAKETKSEEEPEVIDPESVDLSDPSEIDDSVLDILANKPELEKPKDDEPAAEKMSKGEPPEGEPEPTAEELAEAAIKSTNESDPAVAGLIKDLQGERAARQELKEMVAKRDERLAKLEGIVETLQSQKAAPTGPQSEAEVEAAFFKEKGINPDNDHLSYNEEKELKSRLKTFEAEQKEEPAATSQERTVSAAEQRSADDEVATMAEFAVGKAAEGLDYQTVIEKGKDNLSQNDFRKIIKVGNLDGGRPALELYNLCLDKTPELKAKVQNNTQKEEPKPKFKLPKDQPIPKTTGTPSNDRTALEEQAQIEESQIEALHNMTEAQLDEIAREVAKKEAEELAVEAI